MQMNRRKWLVAWLYLVARAGYLSFTAAIDVVAHLGVPWGGAGSSGNAVDVDGLSGFHNNSIKTPHKDWLL